MHELMMDQMTPKRVRGLGGASDVDELLGGERRATTRAHEPMADVARACERQIATFDEQLHQLGHSRERELDLVLVRQKAEHHRRIAAGLGGGAVGERLLQALPTELSEVLVGDA